MVQNFQGEFDWGVLPRKDEHYGDMKAVRFAGDFFQRQHTKPFFLAIGLWHPHIHMVDLHRTPLDQARLREDWKKFTGDSFMVDVTPFHDQEDPVSGFLEVFKYALKFSDLPLADNWTAFQELAGKRHVFSFGLFWGVQVPDELTDERLDDLPFIEMLFQFHRGAGYSIAKVSKPQASSTGIIRVTSGAQEATAATLVSHLTTNKNAIANPGLIAISRDKNEGLDPIPSTNVNTDLGAYPQDDSFFASVGYKGAFDPVGDHWLRGWTALQHNGHLKEFTTGVALKLDLLKDYKVFPNPSFNGFFTVQNQKHESFDIHIFDLTGRLIQQNKSISGQITVDSRGMKKGMYLIKIIDAKSQFATQKLILE